MAGVIVCFFVCGEHGRPMASVLWISLSSDGAWQESCWHLSAGSTTNIATLGSLSGLNINSSWCWGYMPDQSGVLVSKILLRDKIRDFAFFWFLAVLHQVCECRTFHCQPTQYEKCILLVSSGPERAKCSLGAVGSTITLRGLICSGFPLLDND